MYENNLCTYIILKMTVSAQGDTPVDPEYIVSAYIYACKDISVFLVSRCYMVV